MLLVHETHACHVDCGIVWASLQDLCCYLHAQTNRGCITSMWANPLTNEFMGRVKGSRNLISNPMCLHVPGGMVMSASSTPRQTPGLRPQTAARQTPLRTGSADRTPALSPGLPQTHSKGADTCDLCKMLTTRSPGPVRLTGRSSSLLRRAGRPCCS